jgi:peptide/nickel transport system ATP-binding protein
VLGLLPPEGRVTSGSVVFLGVNLLALVEREMQKVRGSRISMVHQDPELALNPVLRVGEQIAAVLRAHGASRARSRERARALLADVGFGADNRIDDAYPHQLSGGEKQRVLIAQAIACGPALVIADEPTASLDSRTQREVRALLKTLRAKLQLAMLLISHDPSELEETVDRIFVMYAGRLVEEGRTRTVLERPLHPYTQGLLRSRLSTIPGQNHKQILPVIPGEPPDLAHLTAGCAFKARCPDVKLLCLTHKPPEAEPEELRRVKCFNYAG